MAYEQVEPEHDDVLVGQVPVESVALHHRLAADAVENMKESMKADKISRRNRDGIRGALLDGLRLLLALTFPFQTTIEKLPDALKT